jgi:hypothetical protein
MLFPNGPIGFAGERKAVALLCLAFYLAFFGLMALLMANPPPELPELRAWWPCFAALALCYGMSFFSLAAGWFWARWFAIGLGYSGLTTAAWGVVMQRTLEPTLVFYGLTHGLIALLLQGEKLAAQFDAQPGWRERLNLDENGVVRVRHTVTRAAASLPTLIMIALAPRESAYGLALLALATLGVWGVLRLRTWGVLALFGAGSATLLSLLVGHGHGAHEVSALGVFPAGLLHGLGVAGGIFLLLSALPFGRPILRYVLAR